MKIADLKGAQEQFDDMPQACVYPGGMCLYLNDEVLKAMGFTEAPPPGTIVTIAGTAEVRSRSEYKDGDGDGADVEANISLQVQTFGMDVPGASAAAKLYGKTSK